MDLAAIGAESTNRPDLDSVNRSGWSSPRPWGGHQGRYLEEGGMELG